MMKLNETIKQLAIVAAFSMMVVGFSGLASAANLYSLPGEDGLELFLLENHLQTPTLDLHKNAGNRVTVTEDGSLTFGPTDSLAKYFGMNNDGVKNDESAKLAYRGFRTSPLGRVLSVGGEFTPNMGPASIATADSQQAMERKFDLGKSQSGRTGWEQDTGFKILSF